jgi:STAS domain
VRDRVKYLVGASDPLPTAVVLEAGANVDLDITSAEILQQLLADLRSAGIDLALADIRQPVSDGSKKTGVLDRLLQVNVFQTVDEAVDALNSRPRPRRNGLVSREES